MHAIDETGYRQAVYEKAARFRSALEQGGLQLPSLAGFPRGACGDICEMLGQFLIDSGLGNWSYRSGVRFKPSFFTHAWLERNGLLLDITADQFDDVSNPVLLTEDRSWHLQFANDCSPRVASLQWFANHDHRTAAHADYQLLKQRAEA